MEKHSDMQITNKTQRPGSNTFFPRHNTLLLIAAGILIEVCFLLYRLVPTNPANAVLKYIIAYCTVFIILILAWGLLKVTNFLKIHLYLILFYSLMFGFTLLTAAPDQSDDIYRYIWDGKLQYYHVSPYKYAPADPALKEYHSNEIPKKVNWPKIKTIYPPAAQLLFRMSYTLFDENVSGMKFLFLLFMIGSSILFYKIITFPRRGIMESSRRRIIGSPRREIIGSPRRGDMGTQRSGDEWFVLFFSWNPLLIMETAINGHLDIMMAFFVLTFLLLFYRRRWILSGIMLAGAVLTKLIPVILTPLIFYYIVRKKVHSNGVSENTQDKKDIKKPFFILVRFFASFSVTILAAYALYFDSWRNMFLTAFNYGTRWFFNNPLFMALLSLTRNNVTAHYLSFGLFILVFLFILFHSMSLEKKIFWTLFAFTFINPTLHPWYLTVLLAVLCIYYSPWVMAWSGTVVITYVIVYQYKLTGIWKDSWWVMSFEYIPLLVLSVWPLIKSKKTANNSNQVGLNSVK